MTEIKHSDKAVDKQQLLTSYHPHSLVLIFVGDQSERVEVGRFLHSGVAV